MNTLDSQPMGLMDRLKTAGQVIVTGRQPNPLAEAPEDKSRGSLVEELTEWATDTRKFWQPVFDRMREEQRFAAGSQWPSGYKPNTAEKEPYVGDIVQQLVNRSVSNIYAKNPTPDAQRLEKMLFTVWDGSQESLAGANNILAMANAGDPLAQASAAQAKAILKDYEAGTAEKAMLEKMAETGQLLIKHRWKTHKPDFKVLMKQAVTQAVVSRVAYLQICYQRDMEQTEHPDGNTTLVDRMASLQQKTQAYESCDDKDSSPLREEIRHLAEQIQRDMQGAAIEVDKITFEGTVYQLVPATSVLIDRNCTCLWEFLGARRIARQIIMDVAAAERRYGVSLKDCGAVLYGDDGKEKQSDDGRKSPDTTESEDTCKPKVCIWHIYDKDAGMCYVVCHGVKDFIQEPEAPTPALERFWPLVAITLNAQVVEINEPDLDVTIFPRSHVRLQMPMQQDINRSGEGLREHRLANRPAWVYDKAALIENDLAKLASPRGAHDVIGMDGLNDRKIADVIQPLPTRPIDPRMYDFSPSLQAAMLATGLQPANLGAQSGGEKATGQAIAEGARISADQSNVDGVDFALSVIAQATWEMEVQETSEATVKEICGAGAMWSNMRRGEVQKEIYLEVEAGSSGRPNEQLAAQKFETVAPIAIPLMQQAGIPLDVLIKEAFRILGIKVDIDDLLRKGKAQPTAIPQPQPTAAASSGPTLPAGTAAPNVAQGGVPGAPPIPPQQRAQVAASAMS